jgi:hypothetical protein
MELVEAVESQTRCFKKLAELSLQFVSSLKADRAQELDDFERRRDAILKTLELFDRKIQEVSADLLRSKSHEELKHLRERLDIALSDQTRAKAEAQLADESLVATLEAELENLGADIRQERRRLDILSRFKSSRGLKSGTGVDQSL